MTGSAVFIGLREECEVAGPTAEGVALGDAVVGVCAEDGFVGTKVKVDRIATMPMGRDKAASRGARGFEDICEDFQRNGYAHKNRFPWTGSNRSSKSCRPHCIRLSVALERS